LQTPGPSRVAGHVFKKRTLRIAEFDPNRLLPTSVKRTAGSATAIAFNRSKPETSTLVLRLSLAASVRSDGIEPKRSENINRTNKQNAKKGQHRS
jgi:hypothetical protein